MRLAVSLLMAASLTAAGAPVASPDLYQGWLRMYDLRFDEAHGIFAEWKRAHPSDPMGSVSNSAAYLFSELARLGILESELFTDDSRFLNRKKPKPDPEMKTKFLHEIEVAEKQADAVLAAAPSDPGALLAKALTFGLRADSSSLVEKQDLTALKYTKDGRVWADRLVAAAPNDHDAYLGLGVENYLLSLKSAPLRLVLWMTGSRVDHDKGIEQLRLTAQGGHFLEPFAQLLLAVAAIRDHNPTEARRLLGGLHERFPNNPLYLRELNRIGGPL